MLKNTFYSADRKVRFEPSGQTLYYGRIRCTTRTPIRQDADDRTAYRGAELFVPVQASRADVETQYLHC
jgi:hypothetical protein